MPPDEVAEFAQYTGEIGHVSARKDIWGIAGLTTYDEDAGFTLEVANEMRRDPTIRAVWRLTTLLLQKHFGTYTHEREEIETFVNETLDEARGWDDCRKALLTAPFYGFCVIECVWAERNGRWVIEKFAPRHPTTLTGGFVGDKHGNLKVVGQKVPGSTARIPIPMGKVIHWPYDAEFGAGESPEGESLLRAAHRSWTSVKALMRLWNLALERGPLPLLAWATASGEMHCPIHNIKEPRVQVYAEQLAQLESTSGLLYEGGEHIGAPEVLSNASVSPDHLENKVKYDDTKMSLSMLFPKMLLEEPEHGTRAMAGTQLDLFLENLAGMQNGYTLTLEEQVAWRLIVMNFAGVTDKGKWLPEDLSPGDQMMASEALRNLTGAGIRITGPDETKIKRQYPEMFVQPDEPEWVEPEEFEPEPEPTPQEDEIPTF